MSEVMTGTSETILVRLRGHDEREPIAAIVYGDWAAHGRCYHGDNRSVQLDDLEWTVSHVPTGYSLGLSTGITETVARELASWMGLNAARFISGDVLTDPDRRRREYAALRAAAVAAGVGPKYWRADPAIRDAAASVRLDGETQAVRP